MLLKVPAYDIIIRPIYKKFCICRTGKSNGSAFTQFNFLIDFDGSFNFFCSSHYTIVITLLCSKDTIFVEIVSKGKIGWKHATALSE